MNIDPALLSLLIVGVVGCVLLSPLFLSLRSKEESNQVPLYQERCSIRRSIGFGIFAGGNIPLWRCAFYDTFMIIAMFSSRVIRYQEIDRIERQRSLLSDSVLIHWRGEHRKETIRIFSTHADKIEKLLEGRIGRQEEGER